MSTNSKSGHHWFSVSPSSGTTPATLTVTVDAPPGAFSDQGTITLMGPESVRTVGVDLQVYRDDTGWAVDPPPVVFFQLEGDPTLLEQVLEPTWPRQPGQTATVTTESGGDWLQVDVDSDYLGLPVTTIQASAENLTEGAYQGSVAFDIPGYLPVDVPVTLTVLSEPPQVTVSSQVLSFAGETRSDSPQAQWLHVSSGGVPVKFTTSSSIGGGIVIGTNAPSDGAITPFDLGVGAGEWPKVFPGFYQGVLEIVVPGGKVPVAVYCTITPGPADPPLPVSIVNAASQALGAVSPGEFVALHGLSLGPPFPAGLMLDPDGKVSTSIGEPASLSTASRRRLPTLRFLR